MDTQSLSCDEVLRIHHILCADLVAEDDPIGYGGLKSRPLLESAVGRQHAGFGPFKKYPRPIENAATLAFGICCDHPFHNGNKRTALVSMLAHLDKNKLALKGDVSQSELYDMMVGLASRQFSTERIPARTRRRLVPVRQDADHQVAELSRWLGGRVDRVTRGERPVTYRQLRPLLKRHGYSFGDVVSGNLIEVCKEQETRKGIVRRETVTTYKVIGRIGYRNEGEEVSRKTMKQLRAMCRLTEADGVDTHSFYDGADVVDTFVNRYRTVLRRLAKT